MALPASCFQSLLLALGLAAAEVSVPHAGDYLNPPPAPAPVIVRDDGGGVLNDYVLQTEIYRREKREVRLHNCRSACTMALSLPNVCVYPDAKLKFHLAYNETTKEISSGDSDQLLAYYPQAVKNKLGGLTRDYKVLTGEELIFLGIKDCTQGAAPGPNIYHMIMLARLPMPSGTLSLG